MCFVRDPRLLGTKRVLLYLLFHFYHFVLLVTCLQLDRGDGRETSNGTRASPLVTIRICREIKTGKPYHDRLL